MENLSVHPCGLMANRIIKTGREKLNRDPEIYLIADGA
jgi:hypothetical protein